MFKNLGTTVLFLFFLVRSDSLFASLEENNDLKFHFFAKTSVAYIQQITTITERRKYKTYKKYKKVPFYIAYSLSIVHSSQIP